MGYRSQVLFWVEQPIVGRLLTTLSTNKGAFDLLFKYGDREKTEEGHLSFYYDHIKWYGNGLNKDVSHIEEFMTALEEDDKEHLFGFHRLGEEFGDHESRGSSDVYCAYPSQNLVFERY